MNCRDFELVVVDIARAKLLATFEQASAVAHVDECATCAARLRAEQQLTVYLHQTAEAMRADNQQASPRLEARLVHAFRSKSTALPVSAPLPQHVTTKLFGARQWSISSWSSLGAIAATLALLALLALFWHLQTSPQPAEHVHQTPNLPRSNSDQQPSTLTTRPSHTVVSTVPASSVEATKPASSVQSTRRQNTKPVINHRAEVARSTSQSRSSQPVADSIEAEVATEFFPISPGLPLDELGSGYIVRVQLPHTALASFGLPINPERASEMVKADVVLGDDGLARAIRFVR